jgi:GNAT superfamily N-acetyltransferase
VTRVGETDLPDLVPLVGAYLEFYETAQDAAAIESFCRVLLAEADHAGVQLLARDATGAAVGFATVYWTWSTTRLARLAVMNDLFVAPAARGRGTAEQLILACRDLASARGCGALEWQTAPDNLRAQRVYERVGGELSRWFTYELTVP